MIKKTYSLEEALIKIQRFCAYQDRCHKEVIQRLKQMGLIASVISTLVSELIKDDFLNEERFSRGFARGKLNIKKWGWIKIKYELRLRGVSQYNIQASWDEIKADYYTILKNLAAKKYNQLNEKDIYKKRHKLVQYLVGKGWEKDLVYEQTKELIP